MLGFDVSERTISRWMKRTFRGPDPSKRWLTFLRNHREAIAAMDFFTVPTVTFSVAQYSLGKSKVVTERSYLRRLDRTLFWTINDLEAKLFDFQHYYNEYRRHVGC